MLCGSSLVWMGVRDGAALFPTVSGDGGGGGGPCDELATSTGVSSLSLRRLLGFIIWIVTFGFLASTPVELSAVLFLMPPGGGVGGGVGGGCGGGAVAVA